MTTTPQREVKGADLMPMLNLRLVDMDGLTCLMK